MAERSKPDVTIPEGQEPGKALMTDDLELGTGEVAQAGHQAEVHYVGVSWSTGAEFDSSWDRGETFTFKLGAGQVIPGWEQGVAGMKVGGRRWMRIPPALAYGPRGAGGVIGANETLVFVVDLISLR
jgi:peptidylprolyl isomerase